jgi:quinol monooxygenase YgiN
MTTTVPDDNVSIFCVMHPRVGKETELRESMLSLVAPTRAEAGCLTYDVYGAADGSLVLFETWNSQSELSAHQQQSAIKEFFGNRIADLLSEDMGVQFTSLLTSPTPINVSQHHE